MKRIHHSYESVSEFTKWVDENWDTDKRRKANPNRRCPSFIDDSKDFYGGTYDSAKEHLKTGWLKGAKRVAELRSTLESSVQKILNEKAAQVSYDVEGEWCDVSRVAVGDPDCCGSWDQQGDASGTKIIKIIANLSVSGSVNHETMFARGAACLAAVDILESLGHRVELIAGEAGECRNTGKNRLITQTITVKPADQPVDLDRLSFILCHPVFFRRMCFRWQECIGSNANSTCPHPFPEEEGTIVLPELRRGSTPSHQDTINEVVEICRRCGIDLTESVAA